MFNTHDKKYARRAVGVVQEFLDFYPEHLTPDSIYLSERVRYEKHLTKCYTRGAQKEHFDILRAFWNWLKSHKYATFNPFRRLNPMI